MLGRTVILRVSTLAAMFLFLSVSRADKCSFV